MISITMGHYNEVHRISRKTLFPLIKKLFKFRQKGLEQVPKDENFIFAANHQSGLDPLLLKSLLVPYSNRSLCLLLYKPFFKIPLVNLLFYQWKAISVDLDNPAMRGQALEIAVRRLMQGDNVLVFPEGRVEGGITGEPLRAQTGVIRMALKARKKIIPVGIKGSYKAWRFPHYFQKNPLSVFYLDFSQKITITFGRLIDLGRYYGLDIETKNPRTRKLLRKLTTELMVKVAKLAGQKYLYDLKILK